MANKRSTVAIMGNGRMGLIEEDVPELKAGAVMVDVKASLLPFHLRLSKSFGQIDRS